MKSSFFGVKDEILSQITQELWLKCTFNPALDIKWTGTTLKYRILTLGKAPRTILPVFYKVYKRPLTPPPLVL